MYFFAGCWKAASGFLKLTILAIGGKATVLYCLAPNIKQLIWLGSENNAVVSIFTTTFDF